MSFGSIITLLKTAALLLALAAQTPNLPQSFRDHATAVATDAITVAQNALAESATGGVSTSTPPRMATSTSAITTTILAAPLSGGGGGGGGSGGGGGGNPSIVILPQTNSQLSSAKYHAALWIAGGDSEKTNAIVASGAQNVRSLGFTLYTWFTNGAKSGEDINITTIPLRIELGGSATITDLTACWLEMADKSPYPNWSVISSDVKPDSEGIQKFRLPNTITVPMNAGIALRVICDISTQAKEGAKYTWSFPELNIANFPVVGAISNETIAPKYFDDHDYGSVSDTVSVSNNSGVKTGIGEASIPQSTSTTSDLSEHGSLKVEVDSLTTSDNFGQISAGSDVTPLGLYFDTKESGQDVSITTLPFTLTLGGLGTFANVTACWLSDYPGNISSLSSHRLSDYSYPKSGYDSNIALIQPFVIRRGLAAHEEKVIFLNCHINAETQNDSTFTFGVPDLTVANLRVVGLSDNKLIAPARIESNSVNCTATGAGQAICSHLVDKWTATVTVVSAARGNSSAASANNDLTNPVASTSSSTVEQAVPDTVGSNGGSSAGTVGNNNSGASADGNNNNGGATGGSGDVTASGGGISNNGGATGGSENISSNGGGINKVGASASSTSVNIGISSATSTPDNSEYSTSTPDNNNEGSTATSTSNLSNNGGSAGVIGQVTSTGGGDNAK